MTTADSRIFPAPIVDQMRTAYLDYAMSVIVARALPDVRDGLKPVQRRILYTMEEQGIRPNSAYRKCARVVGEVMGKYHPHGDAPVYEALVRLAQEFSMRYELIDGQGNFGSVDGDPPAAMRYTECRLSPISGEMLADIDEDTVDFSDNYDGSTKEPTVLPAKLPNLLANGSTGIAVGMATNIPPHNLKELCEGILFLIDRNGEATTEDLIQRIPGPDFPTGGIIKGLEGIRNAYTTGRGRIVVEAKTEFEEFRRDRWAIVVTELPYQVNKASLVEKIAQLARDKRIDGISDVRDESDRHGLRVVVELRRDAQQQKVLNNLFKLTPLRSSFAANMLALVDGQPQVIGLKKALQEYLKHRQTVVRRRSEFRLRKARDRAHILEGLRKAISMLDLVISIIRNAPDVETARHELMRQLELTEIQSQAILDMQLRRLTALDRMKLDEEYQGLLTTIAELEAILADPAKLMAVIRQETIDLRDKFGDARRTVIDQSEVGDFRREELEPHQMVVITLSSRGFIKRIPYDTYKLQHRGGRGVRGTSIREGEDLTHLEVADTHDWLLFFTNRGRVYPLRVFELRGEATRNSKGMPLVGLLPLVENERVQAMVAVQSLHVEDTLLIATRKGEIKAVELHEIANIRARGLNIMDIENGDELVSARLAGQAEYVMLVTARGQCVHFLHREVPRRSRAAGGVRGCRLDAGDYVVAMDNGYIDGHLLVITERGFGKLTPVDKYPKHHRGGVGVRTFNVTDKSGLIKGAVVVRDPENEELVIVSQKGQVIRVPIGQIRINQGRITQGVTVWREGEADDAVASISCFVERERHSEEEVALAEATARAARQTNGAAEESEEDLPVAEAPADGVEEAEGSEEE